MNTQSQQVRIYQNLAATTKALESTSDAIHIADVSGVCIYHNPAFMKLFGYTVNELNMMGIPSLLFADPALGKRIFEHVREAGSWQGEVELKARWKQIIPTILHIDRIKSDDEEIIGFISICTDIRDRKRVEAMQHEQRLLADALLDTSAALTSTLDFDEVVRRILKSISLVVPLDATNIILLEPDGIVRLVERDDYEGKPQLERLKSGEARVEEFADLQYMLLTRSPLVIPDTKPFYAGEYGITTHTPWLNSHIGSPIILRDEVIGFVNIDSLETDIYSEKHAYWLQLFVKQAAIAIQNAQLHQKAQQLAVVDERRRIASNLHDAVSQSLFSARMIAEALPRLWTRKPEAVLSYLEQLQMLTSSALTEMRMLLLELHPERLYEVPLNELISQLVKTLLGHSRIKVKLEIGNCPNLSRDMHVTFYYLVQEALNNIVKHASPTQVTIAIDGTDQDITLRIIDDGIGFDPEGVVTSSLGLKIMHERAQSIGADLTITSADGEGTQILLKWSRKANS